jgi:hypothetical protein
VRLRRALRCVSLARRDEEPVLFWKEGRRGQKRKRKGREGGERGGCGRLLTAERDGVTAGDR